MTQEKLKHAGFHIRLLAGFLDLIFLTPLMLILVYLLSGDVSDYQNSFGLDEIKVNLIGLVVSIPYLTYFILHKNQATIGKRLVKIYVGNPDGSRLSWRKSLARALATKITAATLGIGFVIALLTKEKISFHDFICSTRVFHGKK